MKDFFFGGGGRKRWGLQPRAPTTNTKKQGICLSGK